MAEELIVSKVESRTTDVFGRCVTSARQQHIVIDEPVFRGGPGEALMPAEAFLGAVAACAVGLLQAFAKEDGNPLRRAFARIEGVRTRSNPSEFLEVRLFLELEGAAGSAAEKLVARFKES